MFVDIDGTLLCDEGQLSPGADGAIREARANGNLVVLCTGRSEPLIPDVLREVGYDGAITSGGARAEVGGAEVWDAHFAKDELRGLVELLDARGVPYLIESGSDLFGGPGLREALVALHPNHPELAGLPLAPLARLRADAVGKVVALSIDAGAVEAAVEAIKTLGASLHVVAGTIPVPFGASADISPIGVNKGSAVAAVLAHLGIDAADAVAIGDNYNDAEMFAACGLSIAMGNADPAVQALATEVTGTCAAGGVAQAFDRHQL